MNFQRKTDCCDMKIILYVFLLVWITGCKQNLQFYGNANEDNLYSEEDDEGFSCDEDEFCSITEKFSLTDKETALDILFILDVSESMKKDLEKLGHSMQSLLSQIQDFDWQMAFTTADHGDHLKYGDKVKQQNGADYRGKEPHFGRLMDLEFRGKKLNQQILKKSDDFYDIIFHDTLSMNEKSQACSFAPYCQGDHEQPLRALKSAIERDENELFFREKANFIAIVVTNEDERVEDPENATTAKEVKQTFQSKFSGKKNFYGFGIIVQDEQCYKQVKRKSPVVEYGERVGELARVTQGRNISICTQDYGKALQGVSGLIRRRVLDRIYLAEALPDPHSVEIEMNPKQDVQWQVKGQEIIFNSSLKKGTKIKVTYYPLEHIL